MTNEEIEARRKADQWAYWRAMLTWRAAPGDPSTMPDFDPRHPESGYYRGQRREAVAIWRDHRDPPIITALVTAPDGKWSKYTREDHIGESVFAYCCRLPISHDAYKLFMETMRWPEDVAAPAPNGFVSPKPDAAQNAPGTNGVKSGTENGQGAQPESQAGVGDNLPKAPDEAMEVELGDLIDRAAAWLKETGAIDTQEKADKLANYSVAVAEIEKRAETARETEKRPIIDEGRRIEAKWRRVLDRADAAKRRLKALLTPFLVEQKRKADEAAAAEAAARAKEESERAAALAAGRAPPPPSAPPASFQRSKSVAGTAGRVALKKVTVYSVSDLKAAAAYLAAMEPPPADFVEAVRLAGSRLVKAGVAVPGIKTDQENTTA